MDAALQWYAGWRLAQILGNWGKAEWIWCHDVMVKAVKHRWLHLTFTLSICKVFKKLKMLWISSWKLLYNDMLADGWPRFWEIGVKAEWIWCHDVMVEAVKHHWLYPTFRLYIHKVFEQLEMLWISSWMKPYNDTLAAGWPKFWEIGVRLSGYDAMMLWLCLLSTADCIPLSHYIYIKCLSNLTFCG